MFKNIKAKLSNFLTGKFLTEDFYLTIDNVLGIETIPENHLSLEEVTTDTNENLNSQTNEESKEHKEIEFLKESEGEYILGVALAIYDNHNREYLDIKPILKALYCLPRPFRHHHLFEMRKELYERCKRNGTNYYSVYFEIEGFYTNKRSFLNREDALGVARNANQLIQKTCPHYKLFSEDLWCDTIRFTIDNKDIQQPVN